MSKGVALGVLSSLYAGTGTIFASTVGAAGQAANLGEILAANICKGCSAHCGGLAGNMPVIWEVATPHSESRS